MIDIADTITTHELEVDYLQCQRNMRLYALALQRDGEYDISLVINRLKLEEITLGVIRDELARRWITVSADLLGTRFETSPVEVK